MKNQETFKEKYLELGIEIDEVLNKVKEIPISIHARQLDNVAGFETKDTELSGGGILSIGNYPGKAININQLWMDLEMVLKLVPGTKKISLQSSQGDYKRNLSDKNDISLDYFDSWVQWSKSNKVGLDLNPAIYSHTKAESGYTLSSLDSSIRQYWIEYVKKIRDISNYIGDKLNMACISTLWIPDGSKDITPSRYEHKMLLKESLDDIYNINYPNSNIIDSLESKLFGIGYEFYNVGSFEFYLSYAAQNNLGITLDTEHFHPTEKVSDKISSILLFLDNIVLHLSRGVRWDSDHITICCEVARTKSIPKVHFGTDFFDASLNKVGALALGARAVSKALIYAALEPTHLLKQYEKEGDYFSRLALFEDLKSMPFGQVLNYYCKINSVPNDVEWTREVKNYEDKVLLNR